MRIRTIKPEFYGHPVLGRLPIHTRFMAIGLLNLADDEGFFFADANSIHAALFPHDEKTGAIEGSLGRLLEIEYIAIKEHKTHGPIGQVLKFKNHQIVNRPTKSKIREYFLVGCPLKELTKKTHGVLSESFSESSVNHSVRTHGISTKFSEDSVRTHGVICKPLSDNDLQGTHGVLTESSLHEQGTGNRDRIREEETPSFEGGVSLLPDPLPPPEKKKEKPLVFADTENLIKSLVALDGSDPLSARQEKFIEAKKALACIRVNDWPTVEDVAVHAANFKIRLPMKTLTAETLARHWRTTGSSALPT